MTTATYERDSDVYPHNENGFENTGSCLQYRVGAHGGTRRTHFRRLYTVSDDTRKWDLGEDFETPIGWTLMATGSSRGQYCYILIRKTGTKPTRMTCGCEYGIRHRFCFVSELQHNEISLGAADAGVVVENYWHHG